MLTKKIFSDIMRLTKGAYMDNITYLKLQVSNLDNVLEHAEKLMEPHKNLVSMTERIVNTYSTLSEKEKKSLSLVYKKSILQIVNRSLKKLERMEGYNIHMKTKGNSLRNLDMESIFLG